MKNKFILLIVFFLGITTIQAQNASSESKNTEKQQKGIDFPTTLQNLSAKYGEQYEKIYSEEDKNYFFRWIFDSGVILVFVPLPEEQQYVGIVAPNEVEDPVGGLSYGLILNQSTFQECQEKLAQYKPEWVKENVGGIEYYILIFLNENTFNYLYFYKNSMDKNVLKAVTISTTEL
ncbi:hypothetical protein O2K51_07895 [Apibacter raozihei]|uniref:hypothetical protein n=1 Tax=Apibacter raozihei TaxID=2500547 RepID=UPI000FE2C78A|nr:hypothetical protein [Apibacter raozihei]